MIKKPEQYDNVQINDDFTPLEVGGHKGVIVNVEEYTSPISGNTSLKVYVDTDKNDKQPSYFAEQYKNDTRPDKKWSNGAIRYVSLGEEENQIRMLKSFITAVENSNNNYKYDWNKDINQLKNKKVGLVFGLEEYLNDKQEKKVATKLVQFRSYDKVDHVVEPKVKLVDGTMVSYDDYIESREQNDLSQKAIDTFGSDIVQIGDDALPF